jgi:hypothetical protein
VKPLLCRAVLGKLPAALDVTRGPDKRRGFVDGRLSRGHHVLRDEGAELRVAREHAGELED